MRRFRVWLQMKDGVGRIEEVFEAPNEMPQGRLIAALNAQLDSMSLIHIESGWEELKDG